MGTQLSQNSSVSPGRTEQPRRTPRKVNRVLLAGTGRMAAAAARRIIHSRGINLICGVVDPHPQRELPDAFPNVPLLGSFDRLAECLATNCIDELHIALPLKTFADIIADLHAAANEVGAGVTLHLDVAPWAQSGEVTIVDNSLIVTSRVHNSLRGRLRIVKRAVDILIAATALLLLLPVLLVIAIAITATSRGPIIFRQERVGRGQRIFQMLKFRSMVQNAEDLRAAISGMNNAKGISFKIFDDPRVTRVGAILRRTSLDELPQLWNVIRGDMSLIGPRPIPVWVADQLQDPDWCRRFCVQPGLTGLWQVEGRQQDFEWMAMQDLRYIDNWSILLDLRILLATVPAMIRGDGAH